MLSRRAFIKRAGTGAALAAAGGLPLSAFAAEKRQKLTILHTNDTHSHIDPWPEDGSDLAGLGGCAQRLALINKIRREEANVLLVDAGDFYQGTPYFNLYKGELELKLMSAMRYDAVTIGNHDFDAGVDGLVRQLHNANFPLLSANYNFSDTLLHNRVEPFRVFGFGRIRVGVFGLGIQLDGLVPEKLYGKTRYLDPVEMANQTAVQLTEKHKCDLVVCLSHLGLEYRDDRVSDLVLAQRTKNIDVIIGGHTHTFLDEPIRAENVDGQEVWINQVGWAGVILGRLDIYFEKNFRKNSLSYNTVNVSRCASA